jgi:hypothetical protein
MTIKDLWGDLGELEPIDTPRRILRDQANLLGEKTGGDVVGEVQAGGPGLELGSLIYSLSLVVPALNGYRYAVVRIKHPANLYPAEVADLANEASHVCEDKGELLVALEKVLSSDRVHRVLASLVVQSREA